MGKGAVSVCFSRRPYGDGKGFNQKQSSKMMDDRRGTKGER